uniref:DUF4378 domain-containing protein n=1 Tax=Triticum urartu TaxID=4572 RepID=A0A8R7U7G0_TRIUA
MSESCWSSQCPSSSNGKFATLHILQFLPPPLTFCILAINMVVLAGSIIGRSSFEVNYIPMNIMTKNVEPVYMDVKMMDLTSFKSIDSLDIFGINKVSEKSKGTNKDYIEYILNSANLTKDELEKLLCKQEGSALDPLLFHKLEEMNIHIEWKKPLDDCMYRRLLFDCVNECFEMRCLTYSWEGYVAWSKGMIAASRCLETIFYSEINVWKSMGERTHGELVEKDITTGLGKWGDFCAEALEVSEEVERDILSSLLDEVIDDI